MVTKRTGLTESEAGETADETESTALAIVDGFTEEALRDIDSFDAVISLTGGTGTNIADVLGAGFAVLDEQANPLGKGLLVGQKLLVLKYGVHLSEKTGKEFTTLHIVTEPGDKWIVNDGSTGIHQQCKSLKEQLGTICPLLVPRGLRVSEYDYTDEKTGAVSKAKTYYLNTSK